MGCITEPLDDLVDLTKKIFFSIKEIPCLQILAFKASFAYDPQLHETHELSQLQIKEHLNIHQLDKIPEFIYLFRFVKQDEKLKVSSSEKLVAMFMNNRKALLEDYLRNGEDILPIAFHALLYGYSSYGSYAKGPPEKKFLTPFQLEYFSLLQSTISILAEKNPRNLMALYPLLTEDDKLTEEAERCLFPYLERMFPAIRHTKDNLRDFVFELPPEQRFFGLVLLSKFHQLSLILMPQNVPFLRDASCPIKNLEAYPLPECEKQLLAELQTIDFQTVKNKLYQLFPDFLREGESLFFDLMRAKAIYWIGYGPLPLISSLFASQYADFIYKRSSFPGHDKHATVFLACGIVPPSAIEEAAAEGRIVSIYCPALENPTNIHNAICDLTNEVHDQGHLRDTLNVAYPIRMGLVSWAKIIKQFIGGKSNKITYNLSDMDFDYMEMYSASIGQNILGLRYFYEDLLRKNLIYKVYTLEYQLIITFEMFRDPEKIKIFFSHYSNLKEDHINYYTDVLLYTLLEILDGRIDKTKFNRIKANFDTQFSTTYHVFFYLLTQAEEAGKLSNEKKDRLILLAGHLDRENIFKWERNKGLTIRLGIEKDAFVFVRYITNKNCDVVISKLESLVSPQNQFLSHVLESGITSSKNAQKTSEQELPLSSNRYATYGMAATATTERAEEASFQDKSCCSCLIS